MIPLFGDILFNLYHKKQRSNTFLLVADRFMPTMHFIEPGSAYSACGPFTKTNQDSKKLKETGDFRYIYGNELSFFQHKIAYRYLKDLRYPKLLWRSHREQEITKHYTIDIPY